MTNTYDKSEDLAIFYKCVKMAQTELNNGSKNNLKKLLYETNYRNYNNPVLEKPIETINNQVFVPAGIEIYPYNLFFAFLLGTGLFLLLLYFIVANDETF